MKRILSFASFLSLIVFCLSFGNFPVNAVEIPIPEYDFVINSSPQSLVVPRGESQQNISFTITNNDDKEEAISVSVYGCDSDNFSVDLLDGEITGGGILQDDIYGDGKYYYWDELGWNILEIGSIWSGTLNFNVNNTCTTDDCGSCNIVFYVDPAVQNAERISTIFTITSEPLPVEESIVEEPEVEDVISGNDRDEYGCIPSAGYQWCESLQKCYQDWVEECPTVEEITEPVEIEIPLAKDEINKEQDSLEISFNEESTLDSVTEFTIFDSELGSIEFPGTFDFSDDGVKDSINSLSEVIKISEGVIEIDTKEIEVLQNQSATLTMNDLAFSTTPKILVDGEEDLEGIVSNIQYDAETGVLTFDVEHFTRFEAVASENENIVSVSDTESLISEDSDSLTPEQERSIFIIATIVVLTITVPAMILIKKRFGKKNVKKIEQKDLSENNISSLQNKDLVQDSSK